MRILYIAQVSSHSRYIRRYRKMKDYFDESKFFAFERDYYSVEQNDINTVSLGKIEHGNYFKRIRKIKKATEILKKEIKENDVLYTFGLDTLYIAIKASKGKNVKIVYEIGDIRSVLLDKSLKGKIFRWLERKLLKKTKTVVITSQKFKTEYFEKIQRLKNKIFFLIENKPDFLTDKVSINEVKNNLNEKIVIGYFGRIRCERSLEILTKLLEKDSRFYLKIRGEIQQEHIKKFKLQNNNRIYLGEVYDSSIDLVDIYHDVDLNWISYPYLGEDIGNQHWAITTRFYESLYFKKPMIDRYDSSTSNFVNINNVGLLVNFDDIEESLNILSSITIERIIEMRRNFNSIDSKHYKYHNEHLKLYHHLLKE